MLDYEWGNLPTESVIPLAGIVHGCTTGKQLPINLHISETPSNHLQRTGHQAQPGWRTSMMTCLHWILAYMRLEIWCKIGLSADWCLCTALCTRSGACYYRIGYNQQLTHVYLKRLCVYCGLSASPSGCYDQLQHKRCRNKCAIEKQSPFSIAARESVACSHLNEVTKSDGSNNGRSPLTRETGSNCRQHSTATYTWCTAVSATFKYDEPRWKIVARWHVFNLGSSNLNVTRTTVHHLFCRMTNH